VYGPRQTNGSLEEAVREFMRPPYFPVELDALPGKYTWIEAPDEPFMIDDVEVRAVDVPHIGPTLGFRLTFEGRSVAYVSDHQQPGCGSTEVAESVLELCAGADLLIHDAQYTTTEFLGKHDWGHCTIEYAVEVAAQCDVKELVLFHHDPGHDDDEVDSLLQLAVREAARRGVPKVAAAAEGMTIPLVG
jgi:ribonuclease BN (tRNA processing enzyme)